MYLLLWSEAVPETTFTVRVRTANVQILSSLSIRTIPFVFPTRKMLQTETFGHTVRHCIVSPAAVISERNENNCDRNAMALFQFNILTDQFNDKKK